MGRQVKNSSLALESSLFSLSAVSQIFLKVFVRECNESSSERLPPGGACLFSSSRSQASADSRRDRLAPPQVASQPMSDTAASPRASPEDAVKEPASKRLPDELWVTVLHQLGYKTLLHARCICKRFERLLEVRRRSYEWV